MIALRKGCLLLLLFFYSSPATRAQDTSNILGSMLLPPSDDSTSLVQHGITDARIFYGKEGGAVIASILSFALGATIVLSPGMAVVALTPPCERCLNFPDSSLARNRIYRNAYKKEAARIKKRSALTSGVAGMIVSTTIIVLTVNQLDINLEK